MLLANHVPVHPGTKIATLEEVLDLVNCYGDKGVTINLETKIDPTTPEQTWPVEKYIELIPILEKHGLLERTYIQSFDWRTLVLIHEKYPSIPIVALLDDTTVVPDANGTYPWLGGLNLDDYDGDWVAAAAAIGSSVLSPVHGTPSNLTVNSPGYTPFTTKEIVDEAHGLDMQVIPGPWTTRLRLASCSMTVLTRSSATTPNGSLLLPDREGFLLAGPGTPASRSVLRKQVPERETGKVDIMPKCYT